MKNKIINKETFIEFINERLNGNLYEENGRLYYNGYLSFPDTDVLFLPDNLTVTGSLSLEDQCNTFLPQGLIVAENLNLEYSNVLSLPDNLTVGGGLYMQDTDIASLPDNLTVAGYLDLPALCRSLFLSFEFVCQVSG